MAGRSIRAKFQLSNLEGGKFNLKVNSTRSKEGTEKEGKYVSDSDRQNIHSSSSLSRICKNTYARDEFRGEKENEKTFNNINIVKTPKRKKANTVSKLVCKFSGNSENLPEGESPAKRRRLWGQGGQGH